MKTKMIFRITFIAVLLLTIIASPLKISAQPALCNGYVIQNNTACAIKLDYKSVCSGTVVTCNTQTGVGLAAGASITLAGCATCSGMACNITVRVTDINGNPVTIIVNAGSPTGTFNPAFCTGSSGTVNWSTTTTTIN